MASPHYLYLSSHFSSKTITVPGLIIYPNREGIPQDVILVPYVASANDSLETAVQHAMHHRRAPAIFTYFRCIHWILPDLEELLDDWHSLPGLLLDRYHFPTTDVCLSYGAITFDQKFLESVPLTPDRHYHLRLEVFQTPYELDVVEFPRALGIPKLFDKIILPRPQYY